MKRNGWKELKKIISSYTSEKSKAPSEGELITPLFAMKPSNPVSMSEAYAKVLLGNDLPIEKFIFLTCGIKKKIFYTQPYPSTQYNRPTRPMKTKNLTVQNLVTSLTTPQHP
tara:strand:+ start:69 stop:404 length:336 start_codon:yes stop_codon:yes gene_type:complete